jgi:hypothetical protein
MKAPGEEVAAHDVLLGAIRKAESVLKASEEGNA